MSGKPEYAPKSRYRTRQSGSEVDSIDENASTGIDRVVPDLDRLIAERAAERGEAPEPRGEGRRLVLGLTVALLLCLVIIAALVIALLRAG